MNAQPILDKIAQDAQDAAVRIDSEAREKVAQAKAASRAKIEAQQAATLAQAQRDSDELEQRALRMAELEERKTLLFKKRALIDDVFACARTLLEAMPMTEKRAFFIRQIVRFAAGNETIAISENAPWFDAAFLSDANDALVAQGKPGGLTLSQDRTDADEGVTLRHGGAEIRCTLSVLMDEARATLEQQAAEDLFTD